MSFARRLPCLPWVLMAPTLAAVYFGSPARAGEGESFALGVPVPSASAVASASAAPAAPASAAAGAEPASAAAEPTAIAPAAADPNESRAAFRADLGFAYRRGIGTSYRAPSLRVGFGTQNRDRAIYAIADLLLFGTTDGGLAVRDIKLGAVAEFRLQQFLRVELGGSLGYLFVDRLSRDETLYAPGVEAFVGMNLDLYNFRPRDDSGIFINARVHGGAHLGGITPWGPTLSLGFRY
jgi:hypothetical protein